MQLEQAPALSQLHFRAALYAAPRGSSSAWGMIFGSVRWKIGVAAALVEEAARLFRLSLAPIPNLLHDLSYHRAGHTVGDQRDAVARIRLDVKDFQIGCMLAGKEEGRLDHRSATFIAVDKGHDGSNAHADASLCFRLMAQPVRSSWARHWGKSSGGTRGLLKRSGFSALGDHLFDPGQRAMTGVGPGCTTS